LTPAEKIELALDSGAILGTWVWDVVADRFTADQRFARTFALDPTACREGLRIGAITNSIHQDDRGRVEGLIAEVCSATFWMRSLRRSEALFWRSRLSDDCRGATRMQAVN